MHNIGTWAGDKKWGRLSSPSRLSQMLTLNEIEQVMATTNAQVNELVGLQAEMLLKVAKVGGSNIVWDSADSQMSRINSKLMKNAVPMRPRWLGNRMQWHCP